MRRYGGIGFADAPAGQTLRKAPEATTGPVGPSPGDPVVGSIDIASIGCASWKCAAMAGSTAMRIALPPTMPNERGLPSAGISHN